MTVWIVERECDDPYYGPYLIEIFASEQLAIEFIKSKNVNYQQYYEATSRKVIESLNELTKSN